MIYSKIIIESKQNLGAGSRIKQRARDLRKNMTRSEKILWSYLRKRQLKGMYFRRQHPYGIYILDFYCFEQNLVIELDGKIHLYQKELDDERTRFLESSGLNVLRFKNDEIDYSIHDVLEKINEYVTNYKVDK